VPVEKLGIVAELQARRRRFEKRQARPRVRLPRKYQPVSREVAANGACAELVNPFELVCRLRRIGDGFHRCHPNYRNGRVVHPEAELGLGIGCVLQAIMRAGHVAMLDIFSHRRRLAWVRHVVWWALERYCPSYSYPDLGRLFACHWTTVMYAVATVNRRLAENDPATVDLISELRQRLEG